ncbi:MAG: PSD1 and planctomycete cytochrome C domain-containing protein [Bryobacteraceae bacterium]|nr:PSD1 and planctomycete cytochrome C domain-containing protein [Bryobacteraceae bacterium]
MRRKLLVSLLLSLPLWAADFARDVEPVFKARCYACHGAVQQIGGLRLDVKTDAMKGGYSGPVIVPGKSADSKLIQRVAGAKGVMLMPPAGPKLTEAEVARLKEWIDGGALWPHTPAPAATAAPRSSHWAFQQIRRVEGSVDSFILARLAKDNLKPSPEADRLTLLRRLHIDLTGLPPTPAEIAEYNADAHPGAYERRVDRLLQSPHFGERWARPWLDRARYADSDGYEKDWERPYAWRYRHWVIKALNEDMPFDRFTIEQLAGDLLPNATTEQRVATGFHRNTLTNREGGVDNEQFKFENTVDRTNTTATTWLGLTAGCTQCHDHKFDPLTQKDFYSMFAFFDNVEEVEIDAAMPGEIGPWLLSRGEYRAKRDALLKEYNVAQLQADWEKELLYTLKHPGERTDWDLAWAVLITLTDGGDGAKILQIPPAKRTRREADVLTTHFVRNYNFAVGPDRYKQLKFKELDEKLRALYDEYPQLTQAMTIAEDRSPHATHLRVRGDFKSPGIEVQPGTPAILPPLRAATARATRLDLARWLVSKENPLPARVTVNWIWAELFGRGLVKSVEDFGTRGELPSHPDLLDALASRFQDHWSFKSLIREIVLSSTYRQSSKARPELQETDPDNALLARQNRLRLPAEQVRDAALTASGLISREVGGRSIRPPQPAGVTELNYGNRWGVAWPESKGADKYRRGLYIHFQRGTPYPMLMNFDSPKTNVAQCRRDRSNTPLQALNLLNDPVFLEAAQGLAYHAISAGEQFDARLNAASLRALSRFPTVSERAKFQAYFERQKAVFDKDTKSAGELALPGSTAAEQPESAAWVALSTVLLNLDEFITRE